MISNDLHLPPILWYCCSRFLPVLFFTLFPTTVYPNKSNVQNVAGAQKSWPKLSAIGPNLPIVMTWEDFILLRLSKETKETCIFWGYTYMLLGTNGKHFLQVLIFLQVTRAPGIPSRVRYQKTNQIAWFPTDFQPYFSAYEKELRLCSH